MSWLLEIIIERRRLDSKGLWEAVLHFAVSSSQQKVELLRSLNKLINKLNDNAIDPAALKRERPALCKSLISAKQCLVLSKAKCMLHSNSQAPQTILTRHLTLFQKIASWLERPSQPPASLI